MRFSLIATALAAATLSFAFSPAFAFLAPPPPPVDTASPSDSSRGPTMDLGVDISQAGGTPASVKAYVASLALDTQASMKGGCQTVIRYPAGYQPETLMFCTRLNN